MKKTLCALGALAAVGCAHGQSSVTIYGLIDLGLVYDSGNAAGKSIRISSGVMNGSRIGFKGVEDLGGGYKASFQLETGFCADSAAGAPNFCTGSNSFMGRQAHGDMSGPFGILSAGRQYSLGFINVVSVDPFGGGLAPQAINFDSHFNNLIDFASARINNSITYSTPVFGGFTASAEVALGERTGDWKSGRETGAAVIYTHGPAFVDFNYYSLQNVSGNGQAKRNYTLGGTYDFGVAKVHALAQKVVGDPDGGLRIDAFGFLAGATVPVGPGSLLASYIRHDDRTALNQDASQWGAGYLYPLSKRTTVYTAYARIHNVRGASFVVGNATELGTGNQGFNLGVNHTF